MTVTRVAVIAAIAGARASSVVVDPVPMYNASSYITTVATHPNGILQVIKAPDAQDLPVLHLHGSAYERGEAYGVLMAETVASFTTKIFDDYVVALVESLDVSGLPVFLQKLIEAALPALSKDVAVPLMQQLLKYVKFRQDGHVHSQHDSTTHIYDEMDGMAKGVCDTLGATRCQSELGGEAAFRQRIEHVNYLPELIRMACTMIGATGTATAHGKLVQARLLDFGAVPFSNQQLIVVEHKDTELVSADGSPGAFAHVTFPGFVGVVTGLNSAGLVQSEKVSYNAKSAGYPTRDDWEGSEGTYNGEGLPFVIRRFVEMSPTKQHAEDIIMSANRTWHVYLGLGDSETMDFEVVGYSWKKAKVWTNDDFSELTGADFIKDVTFINKHTQPEGDDLHDLLQPLAGKMTGTLVAPYVPHAHGSGDVHYMIVDHGESRLYVAVGTTTDDGTEFIRKACDAPVIAFDLADVWNMPTLASSELV